MSGSIWCEVAKGIPAGIVALIAAGIAYRQYQVAKAKLNLDLFERRYEVFLAVWEFTSVVVQKGAPSLRSDERNKLTNLMPQIQFLFGKDLADYVYEIQSKHASLWVIEQATQANNGVMPAEHIQQQLDLMKWFADEALEGVKQRFGKYLNFENWH